MRDGAGGNVQFRKLCVFLLFPLFWGCCAGIVSETSPLDGADIEGNSVRARTRKNSERKLAPRGQEAPRTPGGAHTTHHTDYNTPRLPQETTPHSRGHPLHFLTQNSGRIVWSEILAYFFKAESDKTKPKALTHIAIKIQMYLIEDSFRSDDLLAKKQGNISYDFNQFLNQKAKNL